MWIMQSEQLNETMLLVRYENNPILTAADWPYPINSVFNPGAVKLADGTTLLLARVEGRSGISHLCAARSANGIDDWDIDSQPTLKPDPANYPEEIWGIEDPRITYLSEIERYAVTYTAYSQAGPGVSIALTSDFVHFERLGLAMPPINKDAAILPRKVNGRWALIHRPIGVPHSHIWISFSPDLEHWGDPRLILHARSGPWWDAGKIGLSPPPIETSEGWLMLYHSVRQTGSGLIYRMGLALFDLGCHKNCLLRSNVWIFGPEEEYERRGDVGNVVFPCGYTLAEDGDTIRLFYGSADTSIAMATGSVQQMLTWLHQNGQRESWTGIV